MADKIIRKETVFGRRWNRQASLRALTQGAKNGHAGNGGTVGFNEMAMPPDCNGCPGELFNANDTRVTPQATIQASAALIKQANYKWYLTPTPNPNGGKARNPGFVQNTNQSVSFTGVIWYRSQVALKQIPDGTSKVYLFGEKYVDQITPSQHDKRRRQWRRVQRLSWV